MSTTCESHRQELERFTSTGEASDTFLSHLDNCESCGQIVDAAFNCQAKAFEAFAQILR